MQVVSSPVVLKQCAPKLFQVRSVAFLKNLSRYEKQMYTKLLYYIISFANTLLDSLLHYYDSYKLLFVQLASGPQILHSVYYFLQLRTCLYLMTTRQNSCLSPLKELSIAIPYLLQSLSAMHRFPSNSM